jgi:alpha-1,2-mannosyltransferase
MVARVRLRKHTHTNVVAARSPVRSALKLVYYALLIRAYAWCLGFGQEIMANSSWTKAHLDTLLGSGAGPEERVSKVFPPCETGDLGKLPIVEADRERIVLSLAQFRCDADSSLLRNSVGSLLTRLRLSPPWQAREGSSGPASSA